jgi:hypothetical protein
VASARWIRLFRAAGITVAVLVLLVPVAGAQQPGLIDTRPPLPLRPLPGSPAVPAVPGQPPLQQPRRAPIELTPSVTVTEEYNDNIFLNNDDREWDFITMITPGLTLTAERSTWRFNAAYDFSSRLYVRNSDRNRGFDRQNFNLDSFYRLSPELTLSLDDSFAFDTGINAFSVEGLVVSDRDEAWSNTVRPGLTWQIDRLTTLRTFGAWTTQRFSRGGLRDSDIWLFDVAVERALSPRLRGGLEYELGYFDIEGTDNATTHTPRVGVTYAITPTLDGAISVGPTFEVRDSDTRVTPAVRASLRKRYAWGAAELRYDRFVGTAGGLGGTTDNQVIGGSVILGTLLRGLTIEASPQYRTFDSDDDTIDVNTFALPLQVVYQVTPWFGLLAGYNFFHQRSDGTLVSPDTGAPFRRDADQNRVFVGITIGYPIRFD